LDIPHELIEYFEDREEEFAEVMVEAICQGGLYSPNCLEEVFSETRFPMYGVLGNQVTGIGL
jgi:hypothetical protein